MHRFILMVAIALCWATNAFGQSDIIVDKITVLSPSGTPVTAFKAGDNLAIRIEYKTDARTPVGNAQASAVAVHTPGNLTLWNAEQQIPVQPNTTTSLTLNSRFRVPDVKDDITFRAWALFGPQEFGPQMVVTWRRGRDGVYRLPTKPPLPAGSTKSKDAN